MSNYQEAFRFAFEELRGCEVDAVVRNAAVEYAADRRQFVVPFFRRPYLVSLDTGEVLDSETKKHCDWSEGIMILNYLAYAQNIQPSGRLVTLKEVPGGMIFFPAFQKSVIAPLAQAFENDLPQFTRRVSSLNGVSLKMGDAAARFEIFPKVPLVVVIWSGDEEIQGSANILYDDTVEHFSPTETIIGYGYHIAQRLLAV